MSTSRTHIAGVPVADLARQFGTPTFVYDATMIRRRIADLAAFDVVRYAQKACSNLAILDLVRRQGVLVDAVSACEIRRALAAGYPASFTTRGQSPTECSVGQTFLSARVADISKADKNVCPTVVRNAGYAPTGEPPPIVYTADIFDAESLDLCVEHNLHVNCGSMDMIEQYGSRAPGRNITLRINPGFGHGHSQKTNTGGKQSKHGIWHAQLAECLAQAKRYGLAVTGLHIHIGSGTDLEHLSQVCGAMYEVAEEVGPALDSISAGGGLPTVYQATDSYVDLAAYFALWNATRQRLQERFGHALRLEIEPGRYLVAESGYLVTEIRAVKRQDDNTFYLLDAGFNNLARPILYGSYHPMSVTPSDGSMDRVEQEVIVGGPLCESGDIFTQEEGGFVCTRRLPEAKVGELLVIECTGAYGFAMGSNYNSKPLAAEVLIDDGRTRLIRRRQTFEDLVRGEEIPGV